MRSPSSLRPVSFNLRSPNQTPWLSLTGTAKPRLVSGKLFNRHPASSCSPGHSSTTGLGEGETWEPTADGCHATDLKQRRSDEHQKRWIRRIGNRSIHKATEIVTHRWHRPHGCPGPGEHRECAEERSWTTSRDGAAGRPVEPARNARRTGR